MRSRTPNLNPSLPEPDPKLDPYPYPYSYSYPYPRHMATHFADLPGSYKPFVYCWRGGSRSTSMALVLASIGWEVRLLDGGYKRYS